MNGKNSVKWLSVNLGVAFIVYVTDFYFTNKFYSSQLGTEQPLHKLTMVSLTDKPSASSEESNVVDLITEAFRPFSFYCYNCIHIKGKV